METLDVKPAVLFEVEDFVHGSVDFSVAVRPNASFLEPEHRVHACSKESGAKFLAEKVVEGFNGFLHGFLKLYRRFKGGVGFEFHNVELQFFAEGEVWQLNEVDDFAAVFFDDFV